MTVEWVHIHSPQPTERALSRHYCPTCKRRTWMARFFTEWYGWDDTCLHCGDMWGDGEMFERPFAPRWRRANIDAAKRRWRAWKEKADAGGD